MIEVLIEKLNTKAQSYVDKTKNLDGVLRSFVTGTLAGTLKIV